MSSFVIGKNEYIKAAGLVAGLAKGLDLWFFDIAKGKRFDDDTFYTKFVECFEMNALSVQEQYRESSPYTDSNEYRKEFEEYKNSGYYMAVSKEGIKNAIMELKQFFDGCIYQTEKEAYMYKMQMLFNDILVKLMPQLHKVECTSWRTLDNCLTTKKISRLF